MQAIQTKFLPATNARDYRIKASCERGSITIPFPETIEGEEAHRFAVDALLKKFQKEDSARAEEQEAVHWWPGGYVMGAVKGGFVAVGIFSFNTYGKSEASK